MSDLALLLIGYVVGVLTSRILIIPLTDLIVDWWKRRQYE